MSRKTELRDFLRSRRGRLHPEAVGLPGSGHRRVEGLRREEVASLAGVSVDYYTRLEQGRDLVPSDLVLDAIARALMLDDVEREHFFHLVGSGADPQPTARLKTTQELRPEVRRLLGFLSTPALAVSRGTTVLASNAYSRALITDFDALPPEQRSYAHWVFLDPSSRTMFENNWEPYARETVAVLRREAAMYPHDARLHAMIEQLSRDSSEFRAWWAEHQVETHHYGSKRYNHPIAGPIVVFHEATRLREPDHWLYLYWVEPDSPSEAAMRRLQSWVAARDARPASGARPAAINLRC